MAKREELDACLDGFLSMGVPFYDCMVQKDGICVYRRQGGELEAGVPPTGEELYNIYSCSKLITCTAALQCMEAGRFALDDPLYAYIPEYRHMQVRQEGVLRPAQNTITVRHLFTMTAGLSYDLSSPRIRQCQQDTAGRCPTVTLARYLAQEPLLFEPGYRWEYSLCHDVLAALVEVVTGQSFGAYVAEHIFAPAGMRRATFLPSAQMQAALCPQYHYDAEQQRAVRDAGNNVYRLGTEYESGGAGCVTTVEDYLRFLEALRTGKLLRPETVDLLATDQMTAEQRAMPTYWVGGRRGYGLGQQCPCAEDARPDFGWGGAAGAHYFVDRSRGITAYLGTHVVGHSAFQAHRTVLTPLIQAIF